MSSEIICRFGCPYNLPEKHLISEHPAMHRNAAPSTLASEKLALESARKELKELEDSIYAKIRAIDARIDAIEIEEMKL